ncbi:MAG TPA: cation:proton antiporter [Hyphomonadaceae bacterium]|nr:cation:proton antiporter [Hyphomonadaceae bacterium]
MPHSDATLITMLAVGLGLAFVFGAVATRLKLSPLVGYLIAGVVVGPFTPGFVADTDMAGQLAEIGVVLLMFGVGLHFSPKDLLSVRAVAVPATLLQIVIMTGVGVAAGLLFGWSIETGVVFGLTVSVASTVVALRTLQERRLMQTERGRMTVGWLVVEDLAMVVIMVLIPTWAQIRSEVENGGAMVSVLELQDIGLALALTIGKVAVFALIMLLAGKRVVPWILHRVVHMGSRELFRLAVLAIALGVAYLASALFGISFALGALFAGLIMAESELSQQAANETLPLRDAFAVLFFVSVGMLFDPRIVIQNPWPLLATVVIVVVLRTTLGFWLLRLFGQTIEMSASVTASRSQIGEFSFVLAGLGLQFGLLPEEVRDLVLGGAIASIILTPAVFVLAERWTRKHAPPAPEAAPAPPPRRRAVLVGFGRVGSLIGQALDGAMAEYVVIEDREDLVDRLRERGIAAIAGNAIARDVMEQANVAEADLLFVTVPNGFEAGRIVELAREINPTVRVYARAHSDAEVEHLKGFGADLIVSGEKEIAEAMIRAAAHIIPRRLPQSA